jgi:hypothetical protein
MHILRNILKSTSSFSISLLLGFLVFSTYVNAETEGLAISGSFSSQNIKMVAGERYEPSGVTIIIFNNYDDVADIRIRATVVDVFNEPVEGIDFDFDTERIVFIPANDIYEFQIAFTVSEFMLPGTYFISIGAEVIPNQERGIIAVPGVRQRAKLEVFGEAGFVDINLVDVFGNPFTGRMTLLRIDGNSKSEVAQLESNRYIDRIVPGDYELIVTYRYDNDDYEVSREIFTLNNNDELNVTYTVTTVFIDRFTLSPILSADNVLLNASINYTLNNIYGIYENAIIKLDVYYQGEFLETVDLQTRTSFDLGILNLRDNYAPLDGWKNGTYAFTLYVVIVDDDKTLTLTTSDIYEIFIDTIPGESLPIWVIIVGVSIILAFGASFILILSKKQKDDDIVCLDDDPAYLEALSSLIEGGRKL